jgi:cytochrome c biogenesis protein
MGRRVFELLSSMRFAIALLGLVCVASVMGSIVEQNLPWVNYVNQFGPFWAGFFQSLGVFQVYNAPWFIGVMAFLVLSTGVCLVRNTPKMLRQMRSFQEHVQLGALRAFRHRWSGDVLGGMDAVPSAVEGLLGARGFRFRVQRRADGVMVAAKRGLLSRLGYVSTHLAIVVICLGGVLDSGVPLSVGLWWSGKQPVVALDAGDGVPERSRLGVGTWSYRGNVFLPEGQRSASAVLNTPDGMLFQDLPFELSLKAFQVEFYSTGMPKLFASDVEVFDPETQVRFPARIEVNKPLRYKGVTVYQSSFEDGGSRLKLHGVRLTGDGVDGFEVSGEVGAAVPLLDFGLKERLELVGFKALTVEQLPVLAGEKSLGWLGSALNSGGESKPSNVGPSMTYKLRDETGQAREFHSYMLPVVLEGGRYFLQGVRESPSEDFRYMRVPADENSSMAGFLRLRAALQRAEVREEAARRFAMGSVGDSEDGADVRARVQVSALRVLDRFAGVDGVAGGLQGVAALIESAVPELEREQAAMVMGRLLHSVMWEAFQLSREREGLPRVALDEAHVRFVQDAQVALSDLGLFGAPVLFQLEAFDEVRASVFQVTKSPGQPVVYAGFVLLLLGVFLMFYVQERRVFVWLADTGEGRVRMEMAFSMNRQTLDGVREFEGLCEALGVWVNEQVRV